uniref:Uncharacterized protein n=1 Tax=Anopheles culicifacies TaxID=139723 RepID=A0A182ME86_9DIPT
MDKPKSALNIAEETRLFGEVPQVAVALTGTETPLKNIAEEKTPELKVNLDGKHSDEHDNKSSGISSTTSSIMNQNLNVDKDHVQQHDSMTTVVIDMEPTSEESYIHGDDYEIYDNIGCSCPLLDRLWTMETSTIHRGWARPFTNTSTNALWDNNE